MVISPPFLPPRGDAEAEIAWLERAMKACIDKACGVDTEAGSFPVSGQFMWHTGVHMVAPFDADAALAVRAMADGKVVYVSRPAPYSKDAEHPQNYTAVVGPLWSDNGAHES